MAPLFFAHTIGIFLCLFRLSYCDLIGIPTLSFVASESDLSFSIATVSQIVVDQQYVDSRDDAGTTLIPPTLLEFAQTFASDLSRYAENQVTVESSGTANPDSIFLTIGDATEFRDAAGRPTSEGYALDVSPNGITVRGASALGAFWGTRSILQQAVLGDGLLRTGTGTDAPGWGVRGIMLDAGRHYYPPDFIVEMCSHLSFFKQNTFHLHLSDNLYNNVNIYTRERQLSLYAAFRLLSDDPAVAGLNRRANESYTRDHFDYMQQACASRGVTIIPEIEAPGHALVISQWKPEIGIQEDLSLLNISHPDTIPTMKTIWRTFLPWFQSKVVHIGADEYRATSLPEDALAAEYARFVNELQAFIFAESGKEIRIWGTFPPVANTPNVSTDVSIQHWANFEDNAYFDFIKNSYRVLNSDDANYIVAKYSEPYPQVLNIPRIFGGAPGGEPWAPNIFWLNNATNNPPREEPLLLGNVAAQWNDYGPNATTYLEAYYAWRDGLPALADKQWGGNLTLQDYEGIVGKLRDAIPGQNLERKIESKGEVIVEYGFTEDAINTLPNGTIVIEDQSGNAYDAQTNCEIDPENGLHLTPSCSLTTPLQSKGRPYTLSFSLLATSASPALFASGRDSSLYFGKGISTSVTLESGGNGYALNFTLPTDAWKQIELIGRGNRTFFAVDGEEQEFLTKIGVIGNRFVWREIGIEAPLQVIGGGFEGYLRNWKLVDRA